MTSIKDIKEIAGKHLGRTSDGGFTAPYITPDKHDKTLIVPIPREIGRSSGNVDASRFVGYEVWHAYEMSFLRSNGQPVTGVLRVFFPATSTSMIESKSHKLYLNSFDLERFSSVEEVEAIIQKDLSEALQANIRVKLHLAEDKVDFKKIFKLSFKNVDKMSVSIDKFTEDASLLDESNTEGELTFHTTNLRSLCEITRQKDTANCFVYMKGDKLPSIESLFRYIISMRDAQHFHENVTETVFDTLSKKFEGADIAVINLFNRRGGLDIHCVRATSQEVLDKVTNNYDDVNTLFERTLQQ